MAPHADQHAVIGTVGQGETELKFDVEADQLTNEQFDACSLEAGST